MPSRMSKVADMTTKVGLKWSGIMLLDGSSALKVMSKLRTMCVICCFWVFAICSVIGVSSVNGVMLFCSMNFWLMMFSCAPSSNSTVSFVLLWLAFASFKGVDGLNLDKLMELFSILPLYAPKSVSCRWRLAVCFSPPAFKKAVFVMFACRGRCQVRMYLLLIGIVRRCC